MSTTAVTRNARRRRRMITYVWSLGLTVLTVSLIHWELTALLYILATLGVTVLLVVVAVSDLSHGQAGSGQIASGDGPAPGATGIRRE